MKFVSMIQFQDKIIILREDGGLFTFDTKYMQFTYIGKLPQDGPQS